MATVTPVDVRRFSEPVPVTLEYVRDVYNAILAYGKSMPISEFHPLTDYIQCRGIYNGDSTWYAPDNMLEIVVASINRE